MNNNWTMGIIEKADYIFSKICSLVFRKPYVTYKNSVIGSGEYWRKICSKIMVLAFILLPLNVISVVVTVILVRTETPLFIVPLFAFPVFCLFGLLGLSSKLEAQAQKSDSDFSEPTRLQFLQPFAVSGLWSFVIWVIFSMIAGTA